MKQLTQSKFTPLRSCFAVVMAVVVCVVIAPRGFAADGSWNVNANGNWSATGSWLGAVIPGSTTATNSADIATFGFTLTLARTVTVDANRNIGGLTFSNPSSLAYTLSGGSLLLSNGGVIQTAAANGNHTDAISSAIAIQGVGGSGTFTAGATGGSSLLSIGAVTGVSTAANTTTLTLNGNNTGLNIVTGIIGNGSAGGTLAVVKSGSGQWRLSGVNTFSGGLTLNSGTLSLGADAALGTGTFTIAGGSINTAAARLTTNNNAQNWNGDFTFVGSNTLNLGTGAVAMNASRTVTVNASTLTVGGVISGVGFGLTKAGPGTMSLTGANTYTGPTVINGGQLIVNSLSNGGVASAVGASSNAAANLVINSGTLQLTGSSSTDRLFTLGPGGATLSANVTTMAFTNPGAIAFSGSGSRTLTLTEGNRIGSLAASIGDPEGGQTSIVKLGGVNDSAGWTLSGSNSYSGVTTLGFRGSLTAGHANALGNTSQINFRDSGLLSEATVLGFSVAPGQDYSTVFNTAANQLYRVSIGSGVSTTFAANLTSAGSMFEKLGPGTLALGGSNSFASVTVSAGTLLITSAAALGSGAVDLGDNNTLASTSATPITISNAVIGTTGNGRVNFGTATATGDLIFTGPMSLGSANNPSLTLAGLTSVDIQGVISGTSATPYPLAIGVGRTLRLGGDNSSWAANKSAGAGTLVLGHGSALGTGTFTSNFVTLQASTDLAGANAVGNVIVMANDSTVSGSNSMKLSGNFTQSNGSRTLTSSITSGSLEISGTTFLQESGTGVGRTMTVAGSGNTVFSGPIVNGGTAGSSALTITNTGITTLSGTNTYSGITTVSGGVVRLDDASALPGGIGSTGGSSRLTIDGGVIGLGNGNFTRGSGTTAATFSITTGGGFAAYGGDRTVNIGGSSGTATWGSSNFITTVGGTFVLGAASATHTLDFQNPIALGSVANSRTIRVDNGSAAIDARLSGSLSGSAALTKLGNGTLEVTALNAFAGALNVSAGTLLVNGTNSGLGTVTVASGATLGGSGRIAGLVNVSGFLSPGNSPGLLTTGSLVLQAPSTTLIEITGDVRGTTFDAIDILTAGGLTYGGVLTFDIATIIGETSTLDIFGFSGLAAGGFSGVTASGSYGALTFTNDGSGVWSSGATAVEGTTMTFNQSTGDVTFVIVPEPGAIALAGIGIAAAYALRRRTKLRDAAEE